MSQQIMLILCAFTSIAAMAYFVSMILFKGEGGELCARLQGKAKPRFRKPEPGGGGIVLLLKHVGEAASKPFMPHSREKQSSAQW